MRLGWQRRREDVKQSVRAKREHRKWKQMGARVRVGVRAKVSTVSNAGKGAAMTKGRVGLGARKEEPVAADA